MALLRDLDSKQYRVDNQLAEGGEGVICTLVGKPDLVAKLYKPNQRTAEREAKLLAMLVAPPQDEMWARFKHASISWPITVVREEAGGFAGFLMPRINGGYGLINAYNLRAAKFLNFNWREQHQVALNLCAALNSLHTKGYLMGDVNERNILVAKNGLVTLVDTDSFQVKQGGRVFRCPVGVPEYTPAELHGKAFDQVDRLPQHDNFGLAVLIFRLLMRGQHPFNAAQRDLSLSVGKVDEYCIRSGIFPWLEHKQFTRPPSAFPLDILHHDLQKLFKRTFVQGYSKPQLRATPLEWIKALKISQANLTQCTKANHLYQNGKSCHDCPVIVHNVAASSAVPPISPSYSPSNIANTIHPTGFQFNTYWIRSLLTGSNVLELAKSVFLGSVLAGGIATIWWLIASGACAGHFNYCSLLMWDGGNIPGLLELITVIGIVVGSIGGALNGRVSGLVSSVSGFVIGCFAGAIIAYYGVALIGYPFVLISYKLGGVVLCWIIMTVYGGIGGACNFYLKQMYVSNSIRKNITVAIGIIPIIALIVYSIVNYSSSRLYESETLYVNTPQIFLRYGPGREYGKIAIISYGNSFTTTATSTSRDGGIWVKVKIGNTVGWLSRKYLSTTRPIKKKHTKQNRHQP